MIADTQTLLDNLTITPVYVLITTFNELHFFQTNQMCSGSKYYNTHEHLEKCQLNILVLHRNKAV